VHVNDLPDFGIGHAPGISHLERNENIIPGHRRICAIGQAEEHGNSKNRPAETWGRKSETE
ncbi:hypothetical protein, partial [Sphingomonas sp. LH128]|uniref:hypothetical protein n=1 Tax=Sphingomonas sp. LH128 TaxID=473781 RepID=UPI002E141E7C